VSLRTFIVEDDAMAYEALAETLAQLASARVVGWAESEPQARSFLEDANSQWDLAIVDLFLAEGSGLGVLEACRQRREEREVVVLTSHATPEMRARCLALGAGAVFDKGTEFAKLLAFCRSRAEAAGARDRAGATRA
jgi:DNA-binding NarL/FixJ family response regulator